MVLTKYITKSCVLPQMLVANKSDALKELTHLLFDKKKMKDADSALDQVVAREIAESTGIGRGIAIPHARVAGIKTLVAAVGRIPGGVDFMAVDHKPVHLVFLIFYPPAQQTTYLNFVATSIKLLRDPETMGAIMAADSGDAIYDVLEKASLSMAEVPEKAPQKMTADTGLTKITDAHPDLILLARMQLYMEMLDGTKSGKGELRQRIEKIRSMIDPRILRHFDRLMKAQAPALVPVEGDTCQGCFMRLPSKFAQQVRSDVAHIHTCNNCSRFIYVL